MRCKDSSHADPADRIVYATALELGARLVARDAKIVEHEPACTVWQLRRSHLCRGGRARGSGELDSIRPMLDDVRVTVRNENARVPALDRNARERLAAALDRSGVVAAMLIGSQARGDAGPLSDVDIAVWHAPELDAAARLRLQLDLLGGAEAALGTDEIDLVLLNRAAPLMRQRAMRDAVRLLERDHEERVRLETRAIIDYCDTAPLRTTLGRAMRRRIREGSFGRRPAR